MKMRLFDPELAKILENLDKEPIIPAFKSFADIVTAMRQTHEYLMLQKERFEKLINIDWTVCFRKWLGRIIDYFRIRLDDINNSKPLYHLFRIKALVEHYLQTSKFEYYFPEKDREMALNFKKNPRKYLRELNEVFSYLENVYKEEQE